MPQRALWALALLAAALADAAHAPSLAFYALLAAVPVAAAVTLMTVGLAVDEVIGASARSVLSLAALGLTVAAATFRGPLVAAGEIPTVATTAVLAAVCAVSLEAFIAAAGARVGDAAPAERPRTRPIPVDAEDDAPLERVA
jgi:hypothetical protein